MAGTPTGNPAQDTPQGVRGDENGLGWDRPVPQRWAPEAGPATAGPVPPEMVGYVTQPSLKPPVNPAVMRTTPGE